MEHRFLSVGGRRLLCARARPAGTARWRLLVVPPFGEELNKCRRLLALTARALAAQGVDVLWPDLFGTGDSEGDFADASWRGWCADLAAVAAWHGTEVPAARPALLAVRSGALLLGSSPALVAGTHALLWQPALDGARYFQQFLRVRVMAARMAGGNESAADLERLLESQGHVEIAGYTVSAALAGGLTSARLDAAMLGTAGAVHVHEFKSGAPALSAPVEKLCAALRHGGTVAAARCVDAEQFWGTQEISAPFTVVDAAVTVFTQEDAA